MNRTACLALGALLFPLLLFASSSYDVTRYEMDIVPDIASRRVSLDARVFIDNPALAPTFTFGLTDRYDTVDILVNGEAATTAYDNGTITITTATPQRHTVLSFHLSGDLGGSRDDPREVVTDSSIYLLWSDRFYPITFDDWAVMKTTVVLPAAFEVVAPGKKIATQSRGAMREHIFETTHPTVAGSVVASSEWVRTAKTIGGIPITTLLDRDSQKWSEQIFETSAEVLACYADLFGGYPFDGFRFLTIPGIYARRAFPGFVGYSPSYLEKEMTRTGHDAHETALLWWGYTTRGRGPASFQWTEGFGDYAEFLYDERHGKPIPQIFERFRAQYLQRDFATEPRYSELRGNMQDVIHGKYPWLMQVLRYRIGDEAFLRGLRLLFSRYRHTTFTMKELVNIFTEATGEPVDWWYDEWIARPGVPEWNVTVARRREGDGWMTTVTIEQKGELYRTPVEVAIDAEVRRVETIAVEGARTTASFPTVEEPRAVSVDPERRLLLRVSRNGDDRATNQ